MISLDWMLICIVKLLPCFYVQEVNSYLSCFSSHKGARLEMRHYDLSVGEEAEK